MLRNFLYFILLYTTWLPIAWGQIMVVSPETVYLNQSTSNVIVIRNSDLNNAASVKLWFEDQMGRRTVPLRLMQNSSRLMAGETRSVVIHLSSQSPAPAQDRETLFWLVISSQNAFNEDVAAVAGWQTPLRQKIKLLYRPAGLTQARIQQAHGDLLFKKHQNALSITNPSPFYITLNRLRVGNRSVPARKSSEHIWPMLPPFSTSLVPMKDVEAKTAKWGVQGDYGHLLATLTAEISD